VLYGILSLIIDTAAGVLGGILLLRFWMQAVRVRPPIAVAQFTFQLTDWLVKPLRRVLPGVGGYDWASMAGAVIVVVASITIDVWLAGSVSPQIILLLSMLRLMQWVFYGLMGLILIGVVFSWVNPYAPMAPFVQALTDPMLRPLRRFIPLVGSIDLTPLVALLLLQIALRLIDMVILRL
jgi:YggT family protein